MAGVLDGDTMVVGPRDRVLSLLASMDAFKRRSARSRALSPLAKRLQNVARDRQLAIVFVAGNLRQIAGDIDNVGTAVTRELPPRLRAIVNLEDAVTSGVVYVHLAADQLVSAAIQAKDEAAAQKVARTLTDGLSELRRQYPAWRRQLESDVPGLARPLVRVVDQIINSAKIEQEGREIRIAITRPEGLKQLADAAAPLVRRP